MKPSQQRYREDYAAARRAVYAGRGEGPCPFPEDSRRARMWYKIRRQYHLCEGVMDDMAAAYGEFRPDRLAADRAQDRR